MAALMLLVLLGGCGTPPPTAASVQELASAPLVDLDARRAALAGRDDLASIDAREAVDLAWRNRPPSAVSDDLSAVDPGKREAEAALRRAWRGEHVAFSWDNLDPDAQLGPRPERLSLTWLVLSGKLPHARNHLRFAETWVDDYFRRKRWYAPDDRPLALSVVDQVQIDRARQELAALDADALRAHLASLPLQGMSPEEAVVEARIAEDLLGRTDGGAPAAGAGP